MAACHDGWSGALDSKALLAAVFGAIFGAVVTYLAGQRQWRTASGFFAVGVGWLLNVVTEGNKSRAEHNVVFATSLLLLAYFLIVVVSGRRAQRRAG
jgi:hypothetical protein